MRDSAGVTGQLCRQLRWATLGYHHNWDTKQYSLDHHSEFPPCMARLARILSLGLTCFIDDHNADNGSNVTRQTHACSKKHKKRNTNIEANTVSNNDNCINYKKIEININKNNRTQQDDCKNAKSLLSSEINTHDSVSTRQQLFDTTLNASDETLSDASCFTEDKPGINISKECLCVDCKNDNCTGDCECSGESIKRQQLLDFVAEAAIVNYYHPGTSLGPHTDHSEPNRQAPLFSVSFGQPCVFLIGGPNKCTTPTPLGLQSGDIVVMGGPARLAYHAVPLVTPSDQWKRLGGAMETDYQPWRYDCQEDELQTLEKDRDSILTLETDEDEYNSHILDNNCEGNPHLWKHDSKEDNSKHLVGDHDKDITFWDTISRTESTQSLIQNETEGLSEENTKEKDDRYATASLKRRLQNVLLGPLNEDNMIFVNAEVKGDRSSKASTEKLENNLSIHCCKHETSSEKSNHHKKVKLNDNTGKEAESSACNSISQYPCKSCAFSCCDDSSVNFEQLDACTWLKLEDYIDKYRINMNIRQVGVVGQNGDGL
uniref:DNA demethylase ALKBH1-like n=2 Tax=Hirondellea gigas TaxID=1518452 RepID=A0A6A7FZL9_9CRUS